MKNKDFSCFVLIEKIFWVGTLNLLAIKLLLIIHNTIFKILKYIFNYTTVENPILTFMIRRCSIYKHLIIDS